MAFLNIPEDELAVLIANITGEAEAEIEVKLRDKVQEFTQDFENRTLQEGVNKCPPQEVLEGYIRQINGIKRSINGIKNRVNTVTNLGTRLEGIRRPLNVTIQVLLRLPIPSRFLTAGVQNTFADVLNTLKELNKSLGSSIAFIDSSTDSVDGALAGLEDQLNALEEILQLCSSGAEGSEEIPKELLAELRGEGDVVGEEQFPINYVASNGEQYTFDIQITEPDNTAPRRRAVAKDRFGIIRFIGAQSFSSSVDILIRELKFLVETNISNARSTVSESEQQRESEIANQLQQIEQKLPLPENTEKLLINNASQVTTAGAGSLTLAEKEFIVYNSSSLVSGSSISGGNLATFGSLQFSTVPSDFPEITQNDFIVAINGSVIPNEYRTVAEAGSDITVTFDTTSLGYSITGSQDEILLIGKFA